MKNRLKGLAGIVALSVSGLASAAMVNIGGLNVPTGAHFEVSSIYENVITAAGQTLRGVGEVTQINGFLISDLCSGCELTYRFDNFLVTGLSPTSISFSGGYLNFYLGFGANNDFNPFASSGSAADIAAATNGSLFLTLVGHAIDGVNNTFKGTGASIGTTTPNGHGDGLADVDLTGSLNGNSAGAGAIANGNFNTNSILALFGGGPADFRIGSSFNTDSLPHRNECTPETSGPLCISGSADLRGLVIPEPATLAIFGIGLLGLAASRRRKQV